ncbi:MAG: hypothetical protein IPK10_05510 [Bacteroidetes bacterium]|nr:hypothetical protein [Bacteroidota bacterium]
MTKTKLKNRKMYIRKIIKESQFLYGLLYWKRSGVCFFVTSKFIASFFVAILFSINCYSQSDLKITQENKLSYFIIKAFNEYQSKNYYGALNTCEETLKIFQNDSTTYNCQGLIFLKLCQFEKAKIAFDNAIRYSKQFEDAYFNRGYLMAEMNNFKDAIDDYNMVIKINGSNNEAKLNRALVNIETKEYEKSIEDLSELLLKDSNNITLLGNRAFAYFMSNNHVLSKVDCERGLSIESKSRFFLKYSTLNELALKDFTKFCLQYSKSKKAEVQFEIEIDSLAKEKCK